MDQNEVNLVEWRNPGNWSVGFYFSKKDSRTWVPKPIPWMGWTINIGKPAGAYCMVGLLVGLPLFIVLLMLVINGK